MTTKKSIFSNSILISIFATVIGGVIVFNYTRKVNREDNQTARIITLEKRDIIDSVNIDILRGRIRDLERKNEKP